MMADFGADPALVASLPEPARAVSAFGDDPGEGMPPYEPRLIGRILRGMSAARLAAAQPHQFQTWPAPKVTPAAVIADLIRNERSRRGRK